MGGFYSLIFSGTNAFPVGIEISGLSTIVTLSGKSSLILGENKAAFGREGHNFRVPTQVLKVF